MFVNKIGMYTPILYRRDIKKIYSNRDMNYLSFIAKHKIILK